MEPIYRDFAGRLKKVDLAAGGSGGPKGGWQQWVPWWVNEHRKQGAPEFANGSWSKVISALKDKETMYAVEWDRKVRVVAVCYKSLISADVMADRRSEGLSRCTALFVRRRPFDDQ